MKHKVTSHSSTKKGEFYEDAEQTKKIGSIISVAKDLPQNKTIGFLRIKNKNESSSGAYINGKRINF
jgi:hypothetical protein